MSIGDRFGLAGLIVAALAIAITILWPDRRFVGWAALVVAAVLCLVWVYLDRHAIGSWYARYPIWTTLAVGLVGGALSAAGFTFLARQPVAEAALKESELALKFVYPDHPALVIVNRSDRVIRDIKWVVAIWNMDMPERNDPLPIPVSIFDWIRPHQEGGPQNLFDAPIVSPLVKPGNRLLGSASVICPDCVGGRVYIVYIEFGKGGWYAEMESTGDAGLIIPKNFLRSEREQYFSELFQMAPINRRVPIGPMFQSRAGT